MECPVEQEVDLLASRTMSETIRHFDSLNTILKRFDEFLDRSILNRSEDLKRLSEELEELTNKLQGLKNAIRSNQDRLTELNTRDLEAIETKTITHKWTASSWTPTRFTFDISSTVPICEFELNPPTANWKSVSYHNERHNFVAVLKNKRTASAEASVTVLGFKYEIHSDEIKQCRVELIRLRDDERRTENAVSRKQHTFDNFAKGAARYERDKYLVTSDLVRIAEDRYLLPMGKSTSLYTLCSTLKLKSVIWKTHVLSKDLHEKINSPFPYRFFQGREITEELHRSHLKSLRFTLAQQQKSVQTHPQSFSEDGLQVQEIRREFQRLRKQWMSTLGPQCESFVTSAASTLERFDKQVAKALDDTCLVIEDTGKIELVSREVEERLGVMERDLRKAAAELKATRQILALLDLEAWPIEVYACFADDRSAEDAWMNVWRGARQATSWGMKMMN